MAEDARFGIARFGDSNFGRIASVATTQIVNVTLKTYDNNVSLKNGIGSINLKS